MIWIGESVSVNKTIGRLLVTGAALALGACAQDRTEVASTADAAPAPERAGMAALFESYDEQQLATSPRGKAYRGIRDEDYGKWGDLSDAADVREQALLQSTVAQMRKDYPLGELTEGDALSWRLFDAMAGRSASLFPYRGNGYIFDQMNGAQSQMPAFLINIHSVANTDQARAYIQRIEGLGPALDTLTANRATGQSVG